jgi:hypothetical protein
MIGGTFNHIQNRIEEECLNVLRQRLSDGLIDYGYDNPFDYRFMLHNLWEGFYKIAEAKLWMQRLDWFLSKDDTEDLFQQKMEVDVNILYENKKKDRRCFDCSRMQNQGCVLRNNNGKTICLTDTVCKHFVSICWDNYKVIPDK